MKKIFLSFILLFLGMTSSTFAAAPGVLHVTTLRGNWCGYAAYIDVQRQDGSTFYGRIRIVRTGENDPVQIDQAPDLSLRIIRYVSASRGAKQFLWTARPSQPVVPGPIYFGGTRSSGVGCSNTVYRISHLIMDN